MPSISNTHLRRSSKRSRTTSTLVLVLFLGQADIQTIRTRLIWICLPRCDSAGNLFADGQCLDSLKHGRSTEIPVYSFVHHQRMPEKQYLYGASVIIV